MKTRMQRIGAMALVGVSAAILSACADLSRASADLGPAPLNVESPVAGAALAAETGPLPSPTFAAVPAKVVAKDQRTAFDWNRTVQDLNRSGGGVDTWAAENPALVASETAAFEASALKALRFDTTDVPPEDQAARSAAYAESLRRAATPPPPPK